MTTAVCIRCGALKFGALVPCPECGFHPQESEDKAKSIVLTNHYLEEEEIQRISGLIKAGEPVIYPEDIVKSYTKDYDENPNAGAPSLSEKIGCLAVVVGIVGILAWLILRKLW